MKIINTQLKITPKQKLQSKVSGFTIIETLVAIFILTIAVTSFLGLVSQSIMTARYAKNEITANYLAQEAADYIRNERDSFVFLNNNTSVDDWKNNLYRFGYDINQKTLCFSDKGCYFDIDPTSLSLVNIKECSTKCEAVKINGAASIFRRKIKMVINSTNSREVYVYVTVEWLNGNSTKTKELKFSLSNWLDY